MNTGFIGLVVFTGIFSAGCTLPSSSRIVSRRQAGQIQRIEYGTVQKVTNVVIEGERGQIGLYGGGLTGAAAGGGVGHGVGRDLAQAGGAVAGAIAGQAIEEAVTRKDALEVVIKLENGSMVVVTHVGTPLIAVGERVGVASGAGGARVILP